MNRALGGCLEVHPRVGGETRISRRCPPATWGPSPRGRGNQQANDGGFMHDRSIPAWAGKPGTSTPWPALRRVHPRVGGETTAMKAHLKRLRGPSPRGRGNQRALRHRHRLQRSIPAWAGKPPGSPPAAQLVTVHPRVGGETLIAPRGGFVDGGPSPRGRGNHSYREQVNLVQRSIPACGRGNQGLQAPAPRRDGSIPAWAGKPSPQTTCPQR